jgi:hypothetical protein
MKRLLHSLLFGLFFPPLYFVLLMVLIYFALPFMSFPKGHSPNIIDYIIALLSLVFSWSVVIFEFIFVPILGLKRNQFSLFSIIWTITANFMLYSTLFYFISLLFSRYKKPKKDVEQPPAPPPLSWAD